MSTRNSISQPRLSGTSAPDKATETLPTSLVVLLAASAGLSVASLYYSQPMLGDLGADIGADGRALGLVPTLTQLGYAVGILLLAPLGDRFDRRRLLCPGTLFTHHTIIWLIWHNKSW